VKYRLKKGDTKVQEFKNMFLCSELWAMDGTELAEQGWGWHNSNEKSLPASNELLNRER